MICDGVFTDPGYYNETVCYGEGRKYKNNSFARKENIMWNKLPHYNSGLDHII